MKKKLILVTAAVMLAGICAACGSKADNEAQYLEDIKAEKYVTLGEYKGVEISLADAEVTDEYQEQVINNILATYPMPEEVTGAAEIGHEVNIDFVGKRDGVEFEGGTGAGSILVLGSGSFISDLEEGMVGMRAGEVKDVPVTFPEDYHSEDLAGQDAVFTVTMNSVSSYPELSELTDEYVNWLTMGEQTTVEDFKQYMYDSLLEEAATTYDMQKQSLIADAVVADCQFKSLPEGLVNRIKNALTTNITSYATMYGMDMDTYLINAGMMSADQTSEEVIAQQAEESAKRYLAFQAIANKENLNVSEAEVTEKITELAEAAGSTVEEYEASMDRKGYAEYLMSDIVAQFLAANAVVTAQ